MIITLSQESKQFRVDLKVNREQKISDTLLILKDGGILPEQIEVSENRICSERLDEYIDVQMTYQQAGIYNGDILYII